MAINTEAAGKIYPPLLYAVGREKIKEYALAIGESTPIHLDHQAAREAGFPDVVAPPMFAVVYTLLAIVPAVLDPEVGLNFALMVHGAQEFRWGPLVLAGDEVSTTVSIKEIAQRGGLGFYVFETLSENQRGETVCTGTWTNIVREVP